MRLLRLLAIAALAALLAGCPSAASPEARPDADAPALAWPATVGDLRWLVGDWVAAPSPDDCFVERWLPPEAGSLMAVSRHEHGDEALARETMRIMADGDGGLALVVMIDGDGDGGAQVTRFSLDEVSDGRFRANREGDGEPRALVYRRGPDDTLRVALVFAERPAFELTFRRGTGCGE